MLCLTHGIDGHRVFSGARNAEKVGHTANRQNQRVIGYVSLGQDGMAIVIQNRADDKLAVDTI